MTINDPFYLRGYKAYKFYLAVKLHATTDYDIHKYNAAVNATEEAFLKRNDKYWFAKIGKTYTDDHDLLNFFVANWIECGDLNWIGKLTDAQSTSHYKVWKTRQERLTYLFTTEMTRILHDYTKPSDITTSSDKRMPPIMARFHSGEISIETMVIFESLTGSMAYMCRQMAHDEYVFPALVKKIRKYAPFVHFDKAKMKTVLSNIIESSKENA